MEKNIDKKRSYQEMSSGSSSSDNDSSDYEEDQNNHRPVDEMNQSVMFGALTDTSDHDDDLQKASKRKKNAAAVRRRRSNKKTAKRTPKDGKRSAHLPYLEVFRKGQSYYNQLEYAKAAKCFEKVIEMNPKPDITAQSALALTYEQLGQYADAISIIEQVMDMDKDNGHVYLDMHCDLAKMKFLMGDFLGAKEEYNEVIKEQYTYWKELPSRRERDDFKDSVIRSFRGKASVCNELEDHQAELKCFVQVAKLEKSAISYNDIALTHQTLGNLSDALQYVLMAQETDEMFVEGYITEASIRDELGANDPTQYDIALHSLTKALHMNFNKEDKARLLHTLGYLHGQKKTYDSAIALLLQSYNSVQTMGVANQLAYTYCKMKKYKEATKFATVALEIGTAENDPDLYSVYDTLGSIKRKSGDYDSAITAYKQAKRVSAGFTEQADKQIVKCQKLRQGMHTIDLLESGQHSTSLMGPPSASEICDFLLEVEDAHDLNSFSDEHLL